MVDVEAEDAKRLIKLVEILFKDWYVERHNQNANLEEAKAIARKTEQKKKIQKV